jgi:dTDP-3-amino-3,4,6-trideoxy-alpha-D-glucose transaminase
VTVPFLDLKAAHEELRPELDAAIARVLDSGWFILGEELEAFEREFAAYCGAAHCVGVNSGLDAIELLLRGHGIGIGDEVVVPAHTFVATWLGVTRAGATPVPAAVNPGTYNLDPKAAEAAITPRTRALMPVHLYGQPADMDPLRELAERRGLPLLEDAAQAHGARLGSRRAGALADGAAFSFYPGKNLGALGDSGAILTDDDELAERLRLLRNYGSRRKYEHEVAGTNSRMDELQAAALRVKLAHLDEWNARRANIAERYLSELADVAEITLPEVMPGAEPAWHLFVVRHPERDRFQEALRERGIETLIHYPVAPHKSGAYAGMRAPAEQVEGAEEIASQVLSLPMGPHLSEEQAAAVVEAVAAVASQPVR